MGLDGSSTWYGQFGPASTATLVNALARRADRPTANTEEVGEPSTRDKQNAAALVELCAQDLGRAAPGRPARPLFVVIVDTRDATDAVAPGQVVVNLRGGGMATVTAATLESL